MQKDDLKKVQQISFEILKDIKRVCDKHGIEFFLLYGTLLGAARHDGFIPWDDDIDIGMTRDNYLRFLNEAAGELSPENSVQIMGSGSTDYVSELKVGRRGTVFLPKDALNFPSLSSQITVDIFELNYFKYYGPRLRKLVNLARRILLKAKLNWDEKRYLITRIKSSGKLLGRGVVVGLYFLHALRAIIGERGLEWMVNKIYISKNKTTPWCGVLTCDKEVRFWPADFGVIGHKFEDEIMPIPDCWDEMLTIRYGDWRQLPPKEMRYKHDIENWIVEIPNQ